MTQQKSCGCNFNFCLAAKLVVAIPALPAVAYMASLMFDNPALKIAAAIAAPVILVIAAIKVDKIPALQRKIVKR